MRNSYTAPGIVKLLRHNVEFGWVGGVSAGASHAVNYLSRDADRARESFTDFMKNPSVGGVGSLVRGRGYFNAEYIYERSTEKDLPFDYQAYLDHPAELNLTATRADTGEGVQWTRKEFTSRADLLAKVRASSSLPLLMPMQVIDGVPFVDGALSEHGGLALPPAEAAGYDRFFFLGTKPRDYVRPEVTRPGIVRRTFRKHPAVAQALIDRPARYNAVKARLLELEKEGRAYLFFPEDMQVTSTERNVAKLHANYAAGKRQVEREWPAWQEFLAG